jgi:UDP-N-acetylmuramate--alanine ligase
VIGIKPRARPGNGNGIPERVHLVGAGGQILIARGHTVTGSDLAPSEHTRRLEGMGATIHTGHAAEHVGRAGLVVATAAARPDNPELLAARDRGIPVLSRAEMVQRLIADRDVLAVAGTHGKTTTSSLLALMAVRGGLDPLVLLGGDARDLGDANARDGAGRVAVVEADEYREAFLEYEPQFAIVTNIEADHLDYYETEQAVRDAFLRFARKVRPDGTLLVCADSPAAALLGERRAADGARVERYGIEAEGVTWRATRIRGNREGGLAFTVLLDGGELGRVSLRVPGRHNVLNALAALAAAMRAGVDFHRAAQAASEFQGARRRFELVGEVEVPDGVVAVVDDYAHHPTEIRATLSAARQRYPSARLVACFQPHTYTRTQYLLPEFRTCFEALDRLYVLRTYEARETADRGMDARALAEAIESPEPVYVDSFEEAARRIADDLRPGDVFFTLGAGDVTDLGPMVVERLEARR